MVSDTLCEVATDEILASYDSRIGALLLSLDARVPRKCDANEAQRFEQDVMLHQAILWQSVAHDLGADLDSHYKQIGLVIGPRYREAVNTRYQLSS